ncbi:BamA/TamA family outer membrane protein [Robiginitalea sp.]|uniref:BamA/TamA family outer membrane protein n=1 Tax=Robiginitalea sp. TaxID=1902411 RepID=UPI003C716147
MTKTYRYLIGCIVLFLGVSLSGQEQKEIARDSTFDEASKTFLAIPLITNDPAMDTGFGGLGLYFFRLDRKDEISPPSLVTFYAIYSTNNSYIFTPIGRFFWNEDKNRATVGFGTMRINNDFIYDELGNDLRLAYSEIRNFLTLEYSRKIIGEFYVGVLYLGTKTKYTFDQASDEVNDFTEEFFRQNGIEDNFVSSIGLNLSFDNRDYPYYPTRGFTFSIRPKLNAGWLGSENDYVDTDYNFAYYFRLKENMILAANISGGIAWGDVPFDGYQIYGVRNSLRGYEAGKYKGRNMIASQAELRWRFYNKWGAVAFAGTGSIWGNDSGGEEEFERKWLPSAGLGLRYMVSKAKKINIRLDYALGVDGNQGLYFGVMEAF